MEINEVKVVSSPVSRPSHRTALSPVPNGRMGSRKEEEMVENPETECQI